MLHALLKHAERKGWKSEPGFSRKDAKWAICFSSDGRFGSVSELGDAGKKGNKGLPFEKAPDLTPAELGVGRSHFLIESASVVALLDVPEDDAKTRTKHDFFVHLLGRAVEEGVPMPELTAAANALGSEESIAPIRAAVKEAKVKPTDKVTLQIGGQHPVESQAWHAWWRAFRARLTEGKAPKRESAESGTMIDFVTGESVVPAPITPKVRGLADVGGAMAGDVLIGFDKDAFRSYGLEQAANAAVSEENAKAYTETLNRLIREQSRRFAKAKVIHWYKVDVLKDPVDAVNDPLAFVGDMSAEEKEHHGNEAVRKTLDAIWTGAKEDVDLRDNRYYALTASGAAGRVMVRDWMEGKFEDLVLSIKAWFDDLSIVRRDGDGLAPPPKFMAVLGATVRALDELPAPFVASMWHVALRRTERFPRSALAGALRRFTIAIANPEKHYANPLSIGIMKAYHLRMKGDAAMLGPYLNEEHPSPAYQCGRLLAVLAAVQWRALGDVGAGVVQRFYGAASTTPGLVFGRLTVLSQAHLSKIKQENPKLAGGYEKVIGEIWSRIKDRLPATLTLEEQSLFALGYYHQRASRGKGAPEAVEITNEEKNDA